MSSDFDIEKWANDEEAANAFRIVLEAAEGYIANGHEIDSDIMEIALHAHARPLQLEAKVSLLESQVTVRERTIKELEGACDGKCDPESCRPCRADYAEELQAENARLKEALTPSADTKAAYWGEPELGNDWTQIKAVMAAALARALEQQT